MNRIFKAALTAGSAASILLGVGTAAHADTVYTSGGDSSVEQDTANGYGAATATFVNSAGDEIDTKTSGTYIKGQFWDILSGYTMNGWLERSTNGGATWSTLSGVHSLVPSGGSSDDYYAATDNYYDGPGYLARACFQFTSWSGAAVHCTAAL